MFPQCNNKIKMEHRNSMVYILFYNVTNMKGILAPSDDVSALAVLVDAIFVSNHGERQVDTVRPTIIKLKSIVKVVNGACPIFVDSGIRRGSDIFKALAMGATTVNGFCYIFIWDLAENGEKRSKRVLKILREELDLSTHC